MLDFAVKVAVRSHEVERGRFLGAHRSGPDEDEIWDVGAIAALFALSTGWRNLMALQPNAEFYTMGRV